MPADVVGRGAERGSENKNAPLLPKLPLGRSAVISAGLARSDEGPGEKAFAAMVEPVTAAARAALEMGRVTAMGPSSNQGRTGCGGTNEKRGLACPVRASPAPCEVGSPSAANLTDDCVELQRGMGMQMM